MSDKEQELVNRVVGIGIVIGCCSNVEIDNKHAKNIIALVREHDGWVSVDDSLQYKIDELMLEYCPDEMTMDQIANWESHQRKYQSSTNENQIGSKAEDK